MKFLNKHTRNSYFRKNLLSGLGVVSMIATLGVSLVPAPASAAGGIIDRGIDSSTPDVQITRVSNKNATMALDFGDPKKLKDGSNLYLWKYKLGSKNQTFEVLKFNDGNTNFRLRARGTKFCVGINGSKGPRNKQSIVMKKCNGKDEDQVWRNERIDGRGTRVRLWRSSFHMDGGSSSKNGTNVDLRTRQNKFKKNQTWNFRVATKK